MTYSELEGASLDDPTRSSPHPHDKGHVVGGCVRGGFVGSCPGLVSVAPDEQQARSHQASGYCHSRVRDHWQRAALYVTCAELRALAVANNVNGPSVLVGMLADQEPPAETVAVATVVPALSFTVTTEPASPLPDRTYAPDVGPVRFRLLGAAGATGSFVYASGRVGSAPALRLA